MLECATVKKGRFYPMRQLILDLLPETLPSLDNFVVGDGGNAETLCALTGWLAGQAAETGFCLWGEAGAGKSHLLIASGFHYLDAASDALPDVRDLEALPMELAIDNVHQLDDDSQIALFNLFNHLRREGGRLLVAAPQAPAHLCLREDLRTRLGWGLIYRLTPLSDREKSAALTAQAQARALKLPAGAIDTLLRHLPRDMRTLSAFIVALDRYSLEHKRPVTLPLLRELLAQPLENHA